MVDFTKLATADVLVDPQGKLVSYQPDFRETDQDVELGGHSFRCIAVSVGENIMVRDIEGNLYQVSAAACKRPETAEERTQYWENIQWGAELEC